MRALLALLLLAAAPLSAGRLDGVLVARLPNGLTVMVLEDPTLPIVSTQVLYKVGGRNECTGATGLAHFVEHMAFRASERFPDTDVVSRIYAVGGEWHGYTWIDQTTYFETVPRERLPLVLDIQADRMSRLLLPAAELEAERGAVLTELHGYENDPASVLHDAVAAVSFSEHPYRQNVVGWTSDVERITHEDVSAFYRRHYNPANAVLAIAGDVKAAEALELVRKAFGSIPAGEATPPPRTVEPPQQGERRVHVPGSGNRFQIAYRAPAATDPDFPIFLLIQALVTGSTGASFRQDGDPIPARPGSRLHGVADEIASVFAPTAQPYLFSLRGSGGPEVEKAIEERIAALRERPVPMEELERVRRTLLTDLELDVETSEDAAHQMAYYEGIGAFGVLKRLPELVAAVTPDDVQRAAAARLQPWQRTVGRVHPVPPPPVPAASAPRAIEDAPAPAR
ncbi:MAG: M16 family metallopeptidase, partial [Thermoanaerobaculia bacterium]